MLHEIPRGQRKFSAVTPSHTALVARLDAYGPSFVDMHEAAAALREQAGEIERLNGAYEGCDANRNDLWKERSSLRTTVVTQAATIEGLRKDAELFMKAANLASSALDDAFNESNRIYNAAIDAALGSKP